MVFKSSLSDSKSPKVSGTLPSILANINNGIVCMVYTRPLISKSFSSSTKHLMTVPNAQLASPSLSCSIVFSVLKQGLGTYLAYHFRGHSGRRSPLLGRFSFFFLLNWMNEGNVKRWKILLFVDWFIDRF